MKESLTPAQGRVLRAIQTSQDAGEPTPTYRDLCAQLGWKSTGTVRDHLRALERKGYIELSRGRGHRRIRLQGRAALASGVPLLGTVVAGIPVSSEEFVEARVPVPAQWIDRDPHFALRVRGDSMKNAGILEGDCVIVRHQSTANDGDIVVATLEGETTLKRLRRHAQHVSLMAENPRYRPIRLRTDDARIQGVVVGLLREYAGGAKPRLGTNAHHARPKRGGSSHADRK